MVRIVPVTGAGDREAVAALAREIWRRHYLPIIGQAQIDYMLARFQTPVAIAQQITAGYHYYLAVDNGRPVGYHAVLPCPAEGSLHLSKIYVREEQRGRGLGREIIAHVEQGARAMGLSRVWLTVNRHNATAIAFYRRVGFALTAEQVQDIGAGFVMDDLLMTKDIPEVTSR